MAKKAKQKQDKPRKGVTFKTPTGRKVIFYRSTNSN